MSEWRRKLDKFTTGVDKFYRGLYTGDQESSDTVYNATLDQAMRTVEVWTGHFLVDNGVAAPVGATVIGPLPKFIPRKLSLARDFSYPGEIPFTSGIRVASINTTGVWADRLKAASKWIKGPRGEAGHQGELWIIYEAGIAWFATYQTMNDPNSYPDEYAY